MTIYAARGDPRRSMELLWGVPETGRRAAITAWAHDLWDLHLRHPWTLQISQARPVPGWWYARSAALDEAVPDFGSCFPVLIAALLDGIEAAAAGGRRA